MLSSPASSSRLLHPSRSRTTCSARTRWTTWGGTPGSQVVPLTAGKRFRGNHLLHYWWSSFPRTRIKPADHHTCTCHGVRPNPNSLGPISLAFPPDSLLPSLSWSAMLERKHICFSVFTPLPTIPLQNRAIIGDGQQHGALRPDINGRRRVRDAVDCHVKLLGGPSGRRRPIGRRWHARCAAPV